ncbi:MAG: response regulator transcription factor [Sphingobacteriales bacterium]|nr:response regulator transcription factor [Sphingobacteriales bacterium]NCT74781.1 response regulator transcription factor [Chitinophagaceae bacterium]OJW32203.1 MAG: DNA-binding response regulator [Sphingobacteriales bacterium 46-32]
MEKLSCIIVEDEPLAAEVLEDYIKQVPFLDLVSIYEDALFALEALKKQKVDVIFLDIHLPKLKGLDFIKTLKSPPQIIITSAYREYALDGYELNVTDYLLKPINFNRFLMAVNKLKNQHESEVSSAAVPHTSERPHLLININKKKIKVFYDEILYIESRKEYINIVTEKESYLTKYQLTDIEAELDKASFMRIHRSFIVARNKIKAFNAAEVELGGQVIPIGRSYKELVLGVLNNKE